MTGKELVGLAETGDQLKQDLSRIELKDGGRLCFDRDLAREKDSGLGLQPVVSLTIVRKNGRTVISGLVETMKPIVWYAPRLGVNQAQFQVEVGSFLGISTLDVRAGTKGKKFTTVPDKPAAELLKHVDNVLVWMKAHQSR